MRLSIPQPLPELVESKFTAAEASKTLIFSATDVCVIRTTAGIPFQLRYCPALAKKPKSQNDDPQSTSKKKFDPFETPPDELFIANLPGPDSVNASHILVLNKYPVIRDHVILATKQNKPQTHLLEADDLAATHAVLREWDEQKKSATGAGSGSGHMFAFFNSGEHSGASQPHRHIQFLPVERMNEGGQTAGWGLLVDQIVAAAGQDSKGFSANPALPFAHFASRLPPNPSSDEIQATYTSLYTRALEFVKKHIAAAPQSAPFALHSTENGDSAISYNMAMTKGAMVIAPRRSGGDVLKGPDGEEQEMVELNGTMLGGTLMVKAQEQWDLLRKDEGVLTRLLEGVGLPWGNGEGEKL